MKLNNRRTILVGLAFLSICTFWQMYDSVMTLILTDTFKLNETFAGAIMAADNVLALFLLPFFGALSDKTSTRIGRRMPFIVGGTALAAVLMNLIPLLDDRYAANPGTGTLVLFIIVLGLLLVSMGTYRSPAVALMPDVTPKPLRSKANAVINLMGSAGGILVLALGMVFATSAVRNSLMSYTGYFAVIAAIMLVALVIFMLTVREKEWAYEMQQQAVALGIEEETQEQEEAEGGRKLSVDEVRSLILLLLSIVLWFFGYNAVTSKYSVYASNILHKDYNLTLIIAQAAAIAAYLPVGFIAGKIGRKKTILAGVVMLTVAFNVNLDTDNVEIAKSIAKAIRGSSGGFKFCKAIGLLLEDRNVAQVSMNMVNYEGTPLYYAYEMIRALADRWGVRIIGTELVGLTPAKALIDCAEYYLKLENFDCHKQVMEYHLVGME